MLTMAGKFAPMRFSSPFIYISFIFGAVIEYYIWGQRVSMSVIGGFLLILAGTLLLAFLYPKNEKSELEKKGL